MATRAVTKISNGTIQHFVVPAAKACTLGKRVKFSGADNQAEDCLAGEDGMGVALATGAPGDTVPVLLEGVAVVPMKVGTGGSTRGAFQKVVADGVTDQAIADGTTVRFLVGRAMQSGVVGDMIGVLIGVATPNATA